MPDFELGTLNSHHPVAIAPGSETVRQFDLD